MEIHIAFCILWIRKDQMECGLWQSTTKPKLDFERLYSCFLLIFILWDHMMGVFGGLLWGRGIGYWKCGFLALTLLPSVFKCCPQVTTMAISAWSFPSWKRPSPAWKPTRLLYTSVENASRRIFLWGGRIPRIFCFVS